MRIALIGIGLLLAGCGQSAPANNLEGPTEATLSNEVEATVEPSLNSAILPGEGQEKDGPGVGACRMQDGREIAADPIKAVGTEPFWAADTDGRCVTYSTPENQQRTRIWTTFTGTRESGQWTGFLGKDRFVLVTRPDANCSDGMSDKTYPIAVTLTVRSEERHGCATPE